MSKEKVILTPGTVVLIAIWIVCGTLSAILKDGTYMIIPGISSFIWAFTSV
jgi:hypothetical protein